MLTSASLAPEGENSWLLSAGDFADGKNAFSSYGKDLDDTLALINCVPSPTEISRPYACPSAPTPPQQPARRRAAVPCRASGGTRRPPAGSQPPDLYGVPAYPAVTVPIEGGGPKEGGCTTGAQHVTAGAAVEGHRKSEETDLYCHFPTAIVTYDNERAPCATIINVSCLDYPGLLRTIAWVLRGLDLRVEHCILDTNANMAEDTFWVMDSKGRKLSDKAAEGVCDRIGCVAWGCSDGDGCHAAVTTPCLRVPVLPQ